MWTYCRNRVFGSNDGWKFREQRFHGSLLEKSDEKLKGSQNPQRCRHAEVQGTCSELVLHLIHCEQPCSV